MFFVFDIETIPDFDFLRTVIENPEEDDEQLLERACEELGNSRSNFLPPMFHRIISWVGLWVENDGGPRQKDAWSGTNEKEGLESLFATLLTYKDFGLIHHNGRGFDLPVIMYRAMKHGLQMPRRLNHHEIRYRFSNYNVDLLDEFSNYGASSWPKLKHLGYLIDIPFKKTGEGNAVLDMFKRGEMKDIERYCYEDVVATYIVWIHLKFTAGELNREAFDNLRIRALAKLSEIQGGTGG